MTVSLPATYPQTKVHWDQAADDPKQARSEQAVNIDQYNALLNAFGVVAQLALGSGVKNDGTDKLAVDGTIVPLLAASLNTLTGALHVGTGLSSQGAGTVNAKNGVYVNNAQLKRVAEGTQLVKSPVAANSSTTQAHGLGGQPTWLHMELVNTSAEHDYSIGDRIDISCGLRQADVAQGGIIVLADTTNVQLIIGDNIGILTKLTSFTAQTITLASWDIEITPYRLV
jgi:hypothetical protein